MRKNQSQLSKTSNQFAFRNFTLLVAISNTKYENLDLENITSDEIIYKLYKLSKNEIETINRTINK